MTERRRNIVIGLFVLGGLVSLGVLVLLFGAFPNVISGGNYEVTIYFQEEVEDLPKETDVYMLGKRIGRVAQVNWIRGDPSEGVEAVIEVDEEVDIPENAIAVFKEAAIGFGRSRIQIRVPLGVRAKENLAKNDQATLHGQVVGSFEQIVPREMGTTLQSTARNIGELAEALTPAARDIHEILKPVTAEQVDAGQAVGNLASALERMDGALRNINEVIGKREVKDDLVATIGNVRQASQQLKAAMNDIQSFAASARQTAENAKDVPEDLKKLLADVQARFGSISQNVISNSNNLDKVLTGLNTAVETMNEGKGTLGHLLYDNRLYEALVLTGQRLSEVMADLRSLVKTWQEQGVRIESYKLTR